MGSQSAANRNFANDAVLFNVGGTQANCSVREQDGVTGLDGFDKGLLVDGYTANVAIGSAGCEGKLLTNFKFHWAIGEVPDSDLGPWEILENTDRPAGFCRYGTNHGDTFSMPLDRLMRKIETSDIHACSE
jgi:hypothetical protein